MKRRFKQILHQYKVEAFKISHGNDHVAETTKEILRLTDEALNNAYHYHFHKLDDPKRAEMFNMMRTSRSKRSCRRCWRSSCAA